MRITILGCGSSVGVPSVGCACDVCRSESVYNKRSRTSALIEEGGTSVLVDTSPELRMQALQNNLYTLDAVLFTHCHSDHSAGVTDLLSFTPKSEGGYLPVYSDSYTLSIIMASHSYLFVNSGINAPWKKCRYLVANTVKHHVEFDVGEFKIVAFKQLHGTESTNGFLFNGCVAYCTDVKSFPDKSWELLRNKKLLILGCLKYEEVLSHAHVDLCIEWIKELRPEMTVITHMSHDIDYYQFNSYLAWKLPGHKVVVAYDGFVLES